MAGLNPFAGLLKGRGTDDRKVGDDPVGRFNRWAAGTTRGRTSYAQAMAAEKAMAHPVTYLCLDKIAKTVASIPWRVELEGEKQGRKNELAQLAEVFSSPTDHLSGAELRYWMALVFACYGRLPLKVGRSAARNGLPNGLYPLSPPHFRTELDKSGRIKRYVYGVDRASEEALQTSRQARDTKDSAQGRPYAFEIVRPNLNASPLDGGTNAPLIAAGLPAEIITLLMQRAHDTADGTPNLRHIVTSQKPLTRADQNEIAGELEGRRPGDGDGGSLLFLENAELTLHTLDDGVADMHGKIPSDDMARRIAGLFGVPVALLGLGAADGAKFASNYGESRLSFLQDTIAPGYLTPIAEGLSRHVCPEGVRLAFDLDAMPALRDARADRAAKLEKVTFLTDDEKREMCGLPPASA